MRCPACASADVTAQTPNEGRPFSCDDCGLEFFDCEEVHVHSADELKRFRSTNERPGNVVVYHLRS